MGRTWRRAVLDKKDVCKLVEGRFRVAISPFFALLLCVSMLLVPNGYAYADDYEGGGGGSHNVGGSYPNFGTVWYGPTKDVDDDYCYGVVAYTNWDAAIYNLGLQDGYNEYKWTNKKKARLVTESSSFKTFANQFKVGKPELADLGSGWFNNDFAFVSAWNTARDLYGETYCYSIRYKLSLKEAARRVVIDVLMSDDSSGGGSGGDGDLDPAAPQGTFVSSDGKYVVMPVSAWKTEGVPSRHIDAVGLPVDSYNILIDHSKYPVFGGKADIVSIVATNELSPSIILVSRDNYEWNSLNYSFDWKSAGVRYGIISGSRTILTIDGKTVICFGDGARPGYYNSDSAGSAGYYFENIYYRSLVQEIDTGGGDDGGDDEEPPTEWPKPPETVTPTPPDLPTPGDPTTPTQPPDPNPSPDPNPWLPVPDMDTDVTGDDFQALLDALNEHCIHLQTSIEQNAEQLWNLQSALIKSEVQYIRDDMDTLIKWLGNDVITANYNDFKDYLYSLFEWLHEQLNFDVNVEGGQYDDSSVIAWLKKIWSKLGNGISVRPVDPVTDTDGWWDWFSSLLGGLIGSLADIGLDKIGGLVDALDTLKDKFPFCIPWDIAALLGLLVSEPVTPVVQVPLMALSVSNGVQQVGTMTVDLTAYDDVWDAVRWIERIAFCVYLATRTKDFLDLLGKIKG